MKPEWLQNLNANLFERGFHLITPKDIDSYVKNYQMLSPVQRIDFWTVLFTQLCKFESGFNPKATYKEAFKDAKGKNVISTGLFQLSVESLRGYRVYYTQDDLTDPYKNIHAAIIVSQHWLERDGVISSDAKPWLGLSRYWSPFRDKKRKDVIKQETLKLSKAPKTGVETMKTIGIVVGHTKASPGAVSKILGSEYVWNTDLANLIKKSVEKKGHACHIELRDVGGVVGAYKRLMAKKPSVICELHFNSFNGKATGVETLHTDNYDKVGLAEQKLAGEVSLAMSSALGLPMRHRNGIKEISKGERGWYNVAQTLSVASILIESGFGDNQLDAAAMRDNKEKLASAIAGCLCDYASNLK